jgi:hypothetical protein
MSIVAINNLSFLSYRVQPLVADLDGNGLKGINNRKKIKRCSF